MMLQTSIREREPSAVGFASIESISPRIWTPRGAERGFIVGKSGSGKSFLAERVFETYGPKVEREFRGYVVRIDPNHNMLVARGERLVTNPRDILPSKSAPTVHFRPEGPDANEWNACFRSLFESRDAMAIYVDEAYALEPMFGIRKFDVGRNFLNALMTQGRARGKSITFATQRPALIPRHMIAQADHVYQFDLPLEDDRATMAGVIGRYTDTGEDLRNRRTLSGPSRRHNFAYLGPDLEDPIRLKLRG